MSENTPRRAISKRLRYEILRRDNFACRYCGLPAAGGVVQLHIDHVIPVAMGGTNDASNLTAACPDCNRGKRASMPSDAVIMAVREADAAHRHLFPCMHCGRATTENTCDVCDGLGQEGYYIGREAASKPRRELTPEQEAAFEGRP
ncbi:MAG: hypothetical protein NVSMB4_06000 [Acidimicrobiales bacterium]